MSPYLYLVVKVAAGIARERKRERLNAKQVNLWHFKRNPRASAGADGARKTRCGRRRCLLRERRARRAHTGGTLINQTVHVEGGWGG